jgi:ribonuclease BN (tRNA processing enzyme)
MVKGKAELHVLTEFCPFAMGFVIITSENRAIIIDGGTYTEMPNVKAHVGDRPIAAWIITHTDKDHFAGLKDMMLANDPYLDRVECFYANFHTPAFFRSMGDETYASWVEIYDAYREKGKQKFITPVRGDHFDIDGLSFDFLFSKDEKYVKNYSNVTRALRQAKRRCSVPPKGGPRPIHFQRRVRNPFIASTPLRALTPIPPPSPRAYR